MASNGGTDLLLSPEERDRFAAWLEHDAWTDDELVEQIEKQGGSLGWGPLTAELVRSRRADAEAKRHVAHLLRATESTTL